ncbi:hypothetical protein [Limnoraphis robusta]|nr:hypothetical protein [Limnoraphis robusta]
MGRPQKPGFFEKPGFLPQCRREASRYNRGGFIEAQPSTANGLAVR